MSMSRKDYQNFAEALRDERAAITDRYYGPNTHPQAVALGTLSRLVQRFEVIFAEDNDRFSPERFEAAVYRDQKEES